MFLSGLSIDSESNEDWYSFTLDRDGVAGQTASINFDHFAGNLQLQLFDEEGDEAITTANTQRNFEEISLANLGAGSYYLRVLGTNGASNPEYSLNVTGIPEATEDAAEGSSGNDSPALAFDLRDVSELEIDINARFSFGSIAQTLLQEYFQPVSDFFKRSFERFTAINQGVTEFTQLLSRQRADDNAFNFINNNVSDEDFAALPGGRNGTLATIVKGGDPFSTTSQRQTSISQTPSLNLTGLGIPGANANNFSNFSNNTSNSTENFLNNGGLAQFDQFLGNIGSFANNPSGSSRNISFSSQPNSFGNGLPNFALQQSQYNPNNSFQGFGKQFGRSSDTEYQFLTIIPDLSLDNAEDEDWFEFTLNNEGAAGQFVAINFNQDLGDLQLELYEDFPDDTENYQPFLVERANSESNAESISLAGLAPGAYKVRVTGEVNPNYTLTVSAPKALDEQGDFTESHNTTKDNPYDLREVDGSVVLTDLSIHTDNDKDWFEFTTTGEGKEGHRVSIDFSDTQGDLDLILYNSEGEEITRSDSTENFEEVSLEGLAAGTYKFQVFGYFGATNPNYRLLVDAPDTSIESDYLEANNSFADATLLGQNGNVSSLAGLSIHENDTDFFQFTTTGTGTAGNSISIEHESSQGNLNIELYDTAENLVDSTNGANDNEIISLNGYEPGDYYLKVSGAEAATNNYQLYLDAPLEADTAENTNDWTVMVYMTTSNLSEQAFDTINELEYAASLLPSNVNIAVLWDQSERATNYATGGGEAWGTAGRAIIQPDTDPDRIATSFDTSIGEQNTGDPDSLVNFATWANSAATAENYSLIMWNHGGGELGGFNIDDFDNTDADRLYTDELTQALATLQEDGISFNLVAFDACLMAMAEVAYALSDYTDILVGSEEAEEGSGYDYTTALSVLFGDASQVTAEDLASSFVDSFQQQYQSNGRGWDTHSAIDLSDDNLNNLITALDSFTTAALSLNEDSQWNEIKDSRDNASSFFPAPYYRDLGQFLTEIQSSDTLPDTLREAAGNASNALNNLVIDKTSDQRNTQGLSIYLPDDGNIDTGYSDRNEEFLNGTGWNEFLAAFGDRGSDNRQEVPLDWAEANDVAARAFNLNTLTGRGHQFTGLSLHDPTDEDWYRFTLSDRAVSGDKIAIDSDDVTFLLQYIDDAGQIQEKTTEGREISLEGLTKGEYRVFVGGNGSLVPEYSLNIDAPGTLIDGTDWAGGNNSANKAEELGVITSERVFTGLHLDRDSADWFEFELAKVNNDDIEPISVSVNTVGDTTVTAELFDADDLENPISSQTASERIELTTPENALPGSTYQLRITQTDEEASAYTLNFETLEDSNDLNTPINRFQNEDIPGTYLFAGEEESQNIRANFPNFIEEGLAFNVADEPGANLEPLYRFQSLDTPGTYLFAGEQERITINENFSDSFLEEGLAFYVYGVGTGKGEEFIRFQNSDRPGTYLFAGQEEAESIRANFPNFDEEGAAFEVVI